MLIVINIFFTGSPSLISEDEGDGLVVSSSLGQGEGRGGGISKLMRGKRSQLSAHEMAGLLRHWLLDKGHLKVRTAHAHTHTYTNVYNDE